MRFSSTTRFASREKKKKKKKKKKKSFDGRIWSEFIAKYNEKDEVRYQIARFMASGTSRRSGFDVAGDEIYAQNVTGGSGSERKNGPPT